LYPGEDLTGRKYIQQLSRFHNLWDITHSYNRENVQNALKLEKLPGVEFYIEDLPSWLSWLYQLEFEQRIYYYLW